MKKDYNDNDSQSQIRISFTSYINIVIKNASINFKKKNGYLKEKETEYNEEIQERLMNLGYAISGGADGAYGSGVRNAVRQFQADIGIAIDGDVGKETWNALFPIQQNSVPFPGYLMGLGMSDSNIGLLQKKLSDLGYSVGKIDSIYGQNTKNAIIQFQSSNGLTADGIVGKNTWNILFGIKSPQTDPTNPNNKKDDILNIESLKPYIKSEIISYVDGIMNGFQKLKALRSLSDAIALLMQKDAIITKYSKKYKVRKALIQTAFMWETAVEGQDDTIADNLVKSYYEYVDAFEVWKKLSLIEQIATPVPQSPIPLKKDSSTGRCQIYAFVAINAYNFAIDKGIITGIKLNKDNENDLRTVWYKLNTDVDYNVEMATLNLLGAAYEKNGGYDYETDEQNVKRIIARYNGNGEEARQYGERNYGIYKIFEKYNEGMRAI